MELRERFEYIKKCVSSLDGLLEERSIEEILDSFVLLSAVLHILQTSIQSLIDIGTRFLAEMGRKPPATYGEVGEALVEEGVFSRDDARLFKKIVGFRNIVVHRYLAIDLSLVRRILERRLYYDIMRLALKLLERAEERGIDP